MEGKTISLPLFSNKNIVNEEPVRRVIIIHFLEPVGMLDSHFICFFTAANDS